MKVPGDQTNGVVGKGSFSYVTRLFDRERMALATKNNLEEGLASAAQGGGGCLVACSPTSKLGESTGIPRASRGGGMYFFEFWEQSLADRRYFSIKIL